MQKHTYDDLDCWGTRELQQEIIRLQDNITDILDLLIDKSIEKLDNEATEPERFGAMMIIGILNKEIAKIINA